MPANKIFILTALLATSIAATASDSPKPINKSARQSSRDVQIPRALVALLEKDYRTFLAAQEVSAGEGITRQLIHLSVEMTQERPQALFDDVRIGMPTGGGIVDLAEFVSPLKGAFHVKIISSGDNKTDLSGARVFFVSRAKRRIIGGEEFGDGCAKFMEITDFFQRKMSGDGFELYSTDQRYLSVLGGTFVLVGFTKEALHVGSVTFMDSRFPNLTCEL